MSNKKNVPVAGKTVAGKNNYNKKKEAQKKKAEAEKNARRVLEEKERNRSSVKNAVRRFADSAKRFPQRRQRRLKEKQRKKKLSYYINVARRALLRKSAITQAKSFFHR